LAKLVSFISKEDAGSIVEGMLAHSEHAGVQERLY
jgi:hypothetical protein